MSVGGNGHHYVYGVFGDIGGANEGIPALEEVVKRGVPIRYFVSPEDRAKAGDVLKKRNLPYEQRLPEPHDNPKVIVIGTSATAAQGQIEWTQFGKEKGIPVIWVEDLWGTGERKRTRGVSPDVMCTLDSEIATQIVRSVRPDIRVEAVGKHTFEMLAKYRENPKEMVQKVRKELMGRLEERAIMVTYWSGGESAERVEEHLKSLKWLDRLTNQAVVFAPRFHPKLPAEAKEHLRKLAFGSNKMVADSTDFNPEETTIASDINIGDWGTTNMYVSAIFGIPAVMCLFPDSPPQSSKQERIDIGYPQGIPPLVAANAGWSAESGAGLNDALFLIMNALHMAKERVNKNGGVFVKLVDNPGAAKRTADIVMEYYNR